MEGDVAGARAAVPPAPQGSADRVVALRGALGATPALSLSGPLGGTWLREMMQSG
jgi:hypothetical protein